MKKCILWLPLLLLLWGCGEQEVFEQVQDVYQVMALQPGILSVDIPADAVVTAMGSGQEDTIYFCDGYTLAVQTMSGGDLSKTVAELTGFLPEQLTVFPIPDESVKRYALAWTCAGEGGDQVGRMILLDDGAFHYAVTVMCPAETAGKCSAAWDALLDSVKIDHTGT